MTSFAEFTKKKKKQSSAGLSFEEYTESLLGIDIEDIAPIRTTTAPKSTTQKKDDEKLDFFQKGAFKDGYQFGDLTKASLGTGGDFALGIAKGVGSLGEGLSDLGLYGIAGVADAFGADKFADKTKKLAQKNYIEDKTKGADDF